MERIQFEEASTREILNRMHAYMAGEETGDAELEELRSVQDQFRKAALEKLGVTEFTPRFDDYKAAVSVAMMEKMREQFRDNGDRIVVTDEIEALQILTLMSLAKYLTVMTSPEAHHTEETGMMANNCYMVAQEIGFNMGTEE